MVSGWVRGIAKKESLQEKQIVCERDRERQREREPICSFRFY